MQMLICANLCHMSGFNIVLKILWYKGAQLFSQVRKPRCHQQCRVHQQTYKDVWRKINPNKKIKLKINLNDNKKLNTLAFAFGHG